jgi:glutathione S-transferase
MVPILVHLSYSPWSEKARWALDHHHVQHRRVEHLPLVLEPLLRVASRDLREKQTVPRLFVGRDVLRDSLEIARFADRVGRGDALLPSDLEQEILAWVDRSEALLASGRARLMDRMLASQEALREALPRPFRAIGPAVGVARAAAAFVRDKHVRGAESPAAHEARMVEELDRLRAAIRGGAPLLGRFTFADVAVASSLGVIALRPETPLGPAQRAVWAEPELAAAYADLLAWRDAIYDRHRRG